MTAASHPAVRALVLAHGLRDVRAALREVAAELPKRPPSELVGGAARKGLHRWRLVEAVGRTNLWRCLECGYGVKAPRCASTPGAVPQRCRVLVGGEWVRVQRLPVCSGSDK